jgi:hypothetical protein
VPYCLPEAETWSAKDERSDRCVAYRKSGPLTRINILVQISTRASSLADDVRVAIGQANKESHTDRTDGSGSVCVSRGASHRLRKWGQRIVALQLC